MPVLEAIATEAESLGLEVNWQKTTAQALGNIQYVPLSVTVLEQEVSTVEEFVYTWALSSTHQLTNSHLSRHHETECFHAYSNAEP